MSMRREPWLEHRVPGERHLLWPSRHGGARILTDFAREVQCHGSQGRSLFSALAHRPAGTANVTSRSRTAASVSSPLTAARSRLAPIRSRTRRWSRRARAWRGQRILDDGVYASVSEIGEAENISKSYVSRILRLVLLAPDLVEGILAATADQALVLERLERPLPASWEEQRVRILEPKTSLAV
jgi:hypothetical protein